MRFTHCAQTPVELQIEVNIGVTSMLASLPQRLNYQVVVSRTTHHATPIAKLAAYGCTTPLYGNKYGDPSPLCVLRNPVLPGSETLMAANAPRPRYKPATTVPKASCTCTVYQRASSMFSCRQSSVLCQGARMPTSNSRYANIDSRWDWTSHAPVDDVDADSTPNCPSEGGGGNRPVTVIWINHGDALGCLDPGSCAWQESGMGENWGYWLIVQRQIAYSVQQV